ncbi:MAG TPA: hypothetical protein VHF26_13170 [Trebonia sp.]|nr:hypothetical protein [Trebonia sp.]
MSNSLSFDELMGESAEVLPGRETLCVTFFRPAGHVTQAGLANINALNGPILNGSLNHALNDNGIGNGNAALLGIL